VDAGDVAKLTSKLLWHMDMPMPTAGGVNYYAASRLAAQHVKVSLTGHGGDEIFAGYPDHFELAFGTRSMFDTGSTPEIQRAGLAYRLRNLWRARGLKGMISRARARYGPSPVLSLEDQWVRIRMGRLPLQDTPYLHPAFIESLEGFSPLDDYLESFRSPNTNESLDRCLHHDLRNYVAKLLFMEDRVSMAVSIESRVPLLDYRIAELVARVPPAQKVRDLVPKYLLREAARRWLPNEVIERRDKMGFPMPTQQWFGNELTSDLQQVLGTSASRKRGIFREGVLGDRTFGITQGWHALNLELWFRIFIERDIEPGIPLGEVD
jgi:asparagine synthase (glutamine-hydrolysing)